MIFNTFLYGGGVSKCEINCLEQMFTPNFFRSEFKDSRLIIEFDGNPNNDLFGVDAVKQFEFSETLIKDKFTIQPKTEEFTANPLTYEFEAVDFVPNI